MLRKQYSIVLLATLIRIFAVAGTISLEEARFAGQAWMTMQAENRMSSHAISTIVQMKSPIGLPLPLYYASLSPSGYLVMTADDTLPPVLAFSWTSNCKNPVYGTPFHGLLQRQGTAFHDDLAGLTRGFPDDCLENVVAWDRLLYSDKTRADTSPSVVTVTVPVLFDTTWHQEAPFNLLCPADKYGYRAVCGCVPLALAQVLNYYQWPPRGTGTKRWQDSKSSITTTLETDFSADIHWDRLSKSYYYYGDNQDLTRREAAQFLIRLGILCEADYDDETGAFTQTIVKNLPKYLHYSIPSLISNYFYYSDALGQKIIEELKQKRPVLVSSDQHQYVACGLRTEDNKYYCYLNYGWGGADDGWYLLIGKKYRRQFDDILINISPDPISVFRPMDRRQAPGVAIEWDFPRTIEAEAFRLTVEQDGIKQVLSDSILPTDRSFILDSTLNGILNFSLQAKVSGKWQASSEPLELEIDSSNQEVENFSFAATAFSNEDNTVDIEIHANRNLQIVAVTMLRPDLFPDVRITHAADSPYALVSFAMPSISLDYTMATVMAMDTDGNSRTEDVWLPLKSLPSRTFSLSNLPEELGDGGNGSMAFQITSNSFWKLETEAKWLSIRPCQGKGDAEVSMDFVENASQSERVGTIRILYGKDVEAGSFSVKQPSGYMNMPIDLKPGWNLISLPGIPINEATDRFDYPVFQYDRKKRVYCRAESMSEATPYWVYAPEAASFVITGIRVHRKPVFSSSFWNLMGVTDEQKPPENSVIWMWNGMSYISCNSKILLPGCVYWIRLTK